MSRFTWYYTPEMLNRKIVRSREVQVGMAKISMKKARAARAALAARSDGRKRFRITTSHGLVDHYIELTPLADDANAMAAEQGTKRGGWRQSGTAAASVLHIAFGRYTLPLAPLTRRFSARLKKRGRLKDV